MAVSIVEAHTARTAGEYVPASRIRPRADLIAQAGIDFCREHLIVPLWREPSGVVVATTRPRDQTAIRALRERLSRPLIVRLASASEIRIALADAANESAPTDWRRGLADVLEALRILTPAQSEDYVQTTSDEPALGHRLVTDGVITEPERVEAVGLAYSLPNVDLVAHPPIPELAGLLDHEDLVQMRMLPLWAIEQELFLAVADPPTPAQMTWIEERLGFLVRPILVDPADLEARLSSIERGELRSEVEATVAVQRAGLATQVEAQNAIRTAARTGERIESALARITGQSPVEIQNAIAAAVGIGQFRGMRTVDTDALRALPRSFSRFRRVAAIARSSSRVTLAMENPWDTRTARTVAALLGVEVQIVGANANEIDEILEKHTHDIEVLPVGERTRSARLLIVANYIDRAAASAADIDLSRFDQDTLDRLWHLLSADDQSEAVALDVGLPPVHTLLLRPAPEALDLRGGDGDIPLLPFIQTGDLLTVVVSSPAHVEAARALAGRHQRSLRLAIALEEELDDAIEVLNKIRLSSLTENQVRLARLFEHDSRIDRAQVISLFGRMQQSGEPLDIASARLHLLSAAEIRDHIAQLLQADPISLHRVDRIVTTTNTRGIAVSRRVIDDPIDHDMARRIDITDTQRLGAVAVRTDQGTPVLAMVDPLDFHAVAELQQILGEPFLAQPATRADIMEASLRAHGQPAIGDLLFEVGLVNRAELESALELSERSDVRIGEALITLGVISDEELTEQLARQRNMPFVTLRGVPLESDVTDNLPETAAREHQMLPIAIDKRGVTTIALADPTNDTGMAAAAELIDGPVIFVATTTADIRDGLERLYHQEYLEISASQLLQLHPDESAYKVLSRGQKWTFIGLAIGLVVGVIFWTVPVLTVLLAFATAFYIAFSGYKFYLIYRALSHTLEVPVSDEEVAALDDRDLPVYTLLVPLYRETEVLPQLVRGIERLDYPKEKLDVKLLLEEDDVETIAVARISNLPPYFDITIVPDGPPKGKPKACNYGLLHARGEYTVIFDAEDIPEPDQLKRVLVAFSKSPENLICVQAKLNYFNRNQNALTKWFTTEYSTWFDLFLPGLDAAGAPIPLGGTSNHFKVDLLRLAGAWDPYNVTEDADLGLRIFKMGGTTAVVDSTTYEEANSQLDNWIRQRSRWVKGYIQTWLVHMRNPIKLWRQLGTGGFISFQLVIGGTFFGFLLNPLLWGLTAVWFLTEWAVIQEVFPAPVYYMGAFSLYAGNFAFAYMNVAGCLRRRYYGLVKWALLSPVYWVLMSIAAWKGFLQLFYAPFYWEKTVHGLSDRGGLEQLADLTEN